MILVWHLRPRHQASDSSISAASTSKLTVTFPASPMFSPTPAPPLDFALAVPTTNSDDREHEVTNSATSKLATVPSASPTPSRSSEPSQEAALAVSIAPMEHSLVTPARCSTIGRALDTGVLKTPIDSWTSSTPSSTSAPPLAGSPATLISTHPTCSTLGHQANIGPNYAKVAFLLGQSLSEDVSTPEESLSDSPPTLVADIKLNGTNSRSALMIVTLNSGYGVSTGDTPAMFKVLPLSLYAFTMNDFAIKGMLYHEKVFSELQQPWPPPDPFLMLGDQFYLCGNQLVVECGGLQPKPPWVQFIDLARSWSEKTLLSDGFLLESSPWHNESDIFMLLKIPWPTAGSLAPKPPWLLCSEVSVLCHGLQQQQSPSFKGHCIEIKSKLLSLSLVISRVVVLGLFSDWQEQPWPLPVLVEIWSSNTVVQPTPWPSYWCYGAALKKLQLSSLWPPPEQRLMMMQPCIRVVQVDEGNGSGAVELFQSNLDQIWPFTETLAADKSMLLNWKFYLLTYFWMQRQISFPDLCPSQEKYRVISRLHIGSALVAVTLVFAGSIHLLVCKYEHLTLKEDNTITLEHCNLMIYHVGHITLASEKAHKSIKTGLLRERIILWLLWNIMGADPWHQGCSQTSRFLLLVWWRLKHQSHVTLISVASSKGSLVGASFLNFSSTPTKQAELSLVQLLGVMLSYTLNLTWDCFACVRAMDCTEAVYALKKLYSSDISCENSTPFVLVIQVLEINGYMFAWSFDDQLGWEKAPKAYQQLILLKHPGGPFEHASMTMLHWLGIFTTFNDSVDTYWITRDINYVQVVTRVQIQLSALRFFQWNRVATQVLIE